MEARHIGERIRILREKQGKTQKDLAEYFNVACSTWSQYESYKRNADSDMVKKIAEYFKVSIDYLMGNTDEIYDPKDESLIEIIRIYLSCDSDKKEDFINYIKMFNREANNV